MNQLVEALIAKMVSLFILNFYYTRTESKAMHSYKTNNYHIHTHDIKKARLFCVSSNQTIFIAGQGFHPKSSFLLNFPSVAFASANYICQHLNTNLVATTWAYEIGVYLAGFGTALGVRDFGRLACILTRQT